MNTLTRLTRLTAALSLSATRPLAAQKRATDTSLADRTRRQASKPSDEKKREANQRSRRPTLGKTALSSVPDGKVEKHELEREDGKLMYSHDIKVAGKPGVEEVHVDAVSGKILKHEHENPAKQAKGAEG